MDIWRKFVAYIFNAKKEEEKKVNVTDIKLHKISIIYNY